MNDMYCLGRVIHFICHRGKEIDYKKFPWGISLQLFERKPTKFLNFDEKYSSNLKSLMDSLLNSNPAERPRASEVLVNSRLNERISSPIPKRKDYNGICVRPK